MKLNYIEWEKRQIEWWKKKLGISDHGIVFDIFYRRNHNWISFGSNSTVSFVRCNGGLEIKNTDLHHVIRSPSLVNRNYTEYQHFLYNTITDLLDKGLNYQEIADWLNERGYTTTRGKKFRNSPHPLDYQKEKIQ